MTLNLSGHDKAKVLAALYNGAKPREGGWFLPLEGPLDAQEVQEIIELHNTLVIGYLFGRLLEVDLSTDTLDTTAYDATNGAGAAQRALKAGGIL